MKGGIVGFLIGKFVNLIGMLIVVGMIFVAVIGPSSTRSLGHTTAKVGADSANIVITDMIPTFFGGFSNDKPTQKAPAKKK